ncbi:unnamed protein product [Orchesella dallaii]|uniref:Venom serine protease 34 n=1 Tax=Orchesella dallaii TaxID=48710 RepID=A0ABP1PMW8_9HEXA
MQSGAVVLFALFGLTFGAPQVVPEPRATSSCSFSHTFTAVGQQAYLNSPSWPNAYSDNADCLYKLASPAGTNIVLNCTEFNVEFTSGCNYDRMTVSLSGDSTLRDGMVACGKGTFTQSSTTNALAVGFKSDSSNPTSASLFRFQCVLTVTGKEAPAPAAAPTTTTQRPATTFSNNTCSCGTRNEATRIVGGTNAEINEFPWRTALYNEKMGVFCGGTIISPNWVLTAAHCTAALSSGASLYIDVGDHDLTATTEANNELIKCDRIIQHEKYNNETQDNDMALCHLVKPLTYSRTVQPACLPWNMATETFQGKTVTASGWGTTSSGGSASMVLKNVDLPVKTTQECQAYYQDSITNNMFCTYNPGKDTCQGDSGGSIDYKDPSSGRYYSIGVVSWGVGCANTNQPGVYAKVTNYLSWLQTKTGDNFCR